MSENNSENQVTLSSETQLFFLFQRIKNILIHLERVASRIFVFKMMLQSYLATEQTSSVQRTRVFFPLRRFANFIFLEFNRRCKQVKNAQFSTKWTPENHRPFFLLFRVHAKTKTTRNEIGNIWWTKLQYHPTSRFVNALYLTFYCFPKWCLEN